MELKGKLLQVYLYVLKHNEVGVREVQRSLGFKSPSLAEYYLKKLENMGLVYESKGKYYLSNSQKPEIISHLVKVGSFLIPRMIFYGLFYLALSVYYVIRILFYGVSLIDVFVLSILLVSSSIIFIVEAILSYRRLF
ncbi:MAG: helix-turn-helix domain-containing protein [Thermoproteota archaeon]|jgi:hypothetical protein